MNKRQRKKAKKKRMDKLHSDIRKILSYMKMNSKRILMSIWDEEYPPYQTKINP
jgi:hypothetical protein